MKSTPIKILIGFLTLFIGIGAFICWNVSLMSQPQIEISDETTNEQTVVLNTCQLIDSPTEFDEKLITLEAIAYVHDGSIILSQKNCSIKSDNWFESSLNPELELGNFDGKHNNLNELLEGKIEVDVIVTGVAKTGFAKGYSASIFVYYITPAEIKLTSPFRRFVPKH